MSELVVAVGEGLGDLVFEGVFFVFAVMDLLFEKFAGFFGFALGGGMSFSLFPGVAGGFWFFLLGLLAGSASAADSAGDSGVFLLGGIPVTGEVAGIGLQFFVGDLGDVVDDFVEEIAVV